MSVVPGRNRARARVEALVRALEHLAPVAEAEPWDNVGLLVGSPAQPLSRVLLAIDYTPAVAAEGARAGVDAVVAYHPPIFSGLKRIDPRGVVHDAIRRGVAIYSLHTALDVAPGGTNDVLADALGLAERAPLRPRPSPSTLGMGRVGEVAPASRGALVARVREALGLEHVLVAGPMRGRVRRVAACAGACGEYLDDALSAGVELFVTGELKHHDALRAAAAGMTTLCTLHSNSERAALGRVRTVLARELDGVRVLLSKADRDPFVVL